MSPLRQECIMFIEHWHHNLHKEGIQNVLDIGIAGDPKPGGNYYLHKDRDYKTMDVDGRYKPNIVGDITRPDDLKNHLGQFDLVIFSNTIEHVYDTRAALAGCLSLLKPGGWLIVDCPWVYPYHAEDDFDDYWRISATAMEKLLFEAGFDAVSKKQGIWCTSAMARKRPQ